MPRPVDELKRGAWLLERRWRAGIEDYVNDLRWSPDGRYLATGGGPAAIVWDCSGSGPEGTCPAVLEGYEDFIADLSFQSRGPLLASGSAVSRLTWSPEDATVAVGGEAGNVEILAIR